jgi:hypothetical protein
MIGVRIGMLGRVIKELGLKIDETGLKHKRVLQEGFQVAIEESEEKLMEKMEAMVSG